jgi:asparagine synthase (glutamine-hydrolysing)
LRQLLHRYVPRELFDRPKKGFAVPIERWLRGELKEWAGDLLEPAKMRREGYFATERIQRRWQQHLAGQMNWSSHLWGVLMFQSWLGDFHGLADEPVRVHPATLARHPELAATS